jgi:hypothetical protein
MTCHRLHVAIVGLILVGCAGGPDPLRTPTPAEVPALESAFEADPADVDLGLLLSAAYREAGRTDDAFDLIEGLRTTRASLSWLASLTRTPGDMGRLESCTRIFFLRPRPDR